MSCDNRLKYCPALAGLFRRHGQRCTGVSTGVFTGVTAFAWLRRHQGTPLVVFVRIIGEGLLS
jgi:uncharacterized membrane protein